MRKEYNLSQLEWTLSGWHPEGWRLGVSMEIGMQISPDVAPIKVCVPGSVQQALLNANLLPDWNVKLNSRQCEWVENRHWVFETILPAEWTASAGKKVLRCEGLDYQGVILVNCKEAYSFCGTFTPYEFDLTPFLQDGANQLDIVFTGIPDYLGQIGYTSRIRQWKPRFNYVWDWIPRLVQIGIWDSITLAVKKGDAIDSLRIYTDYDRVAQTGKVAVSAAICTDTASTVEMIIMGEEGEVFRQTLPIDSELHANPCGFKVRSWWPNGSGPQPLYTFSMKLLDQEGQMLDEQFRTIGFRHIEWKPCAGAPADAKPWICEINGTAVFLQGFNWVPIRPNFADVTEEDYLIRLKAYRDMGTNILRVWGGGILEKECFYQLCDQLGIMVWQEFPLSSSGLDNWPPEDPEIIVQMKEIASSYIRRRQHHPSLLMWCGGNELQGTLDGRKASTGKPIDIHHPMMMVLSELIRKIDPTRCFIPTSSSGPRFTADAVEFGKGLHHDVHGPWNHTGELDSWMRYWDADDALFRSETGMPGSSSVDMLKKYGQEMAWPGNKDNLYWMHISSWWIQWEDYMAAGGDLDDMEAYVVWSQERQAQAISYAAQACKNRFPACGGFMVWMGHDCFPCPINTSVIDFYGNYKPAALALKEVFLR